jgi:hypothetical protein
MTDHESEDREHVRRQPEFRGYLQRPVPDRADEHSPQSEGFRCQGGVLGRQGDVDEPQQS